ncbi:FCS-Like Zinc finger 6 [Oryza brachyantha]|uniref:FCS-Like Zinc finger 6 n=1 Tax=Oryza brachyantha TaxID=4533 RepID=UPI001ADC62C4|nr:FCS-Like Zinc finger 6 [Oryza brachyantha]
MMVGKRGRGGGKNSAAVPMRRTTSMTEFSPPDVLAVVAEEEGEDMEAMVVVDGCGGGDDDGRQDWLASFGGGGGRGGGGGAPGQDWLAAYRARAAPARAGIRRNSADYCAVETAAFLRACGLCRRRLGPGRDTFMYKGEAAFCSLECRQQHMTQEEWNDKCAVLTSRKKEAPANGRARSSKATTGGTVAAA